MPQTESAERMTTFPVRLSYCPAAVATVCWSTFPLCKLCVPKHDQGGAASSQKLVSAERMTTFPVRLSYCPAAVATVCWSTFPLCKLHVPKHDQGGAASSQKLVLQGNLHLAQWGNVLQASICSGDGIGKSLSVDVAASVVA